MDKVLSGKYMSQYVLAPPDVPRFFYGSYVSSWRDLIYWSKREHIARLRYLADNGYVKEFRRFQREWSPIRILAELPGFRRMCALMGETVWKRLLKEEKDFIISCLKLRELLKRDSV